MPSKHGLKKHKIQGDVCSKTHKQFQHLTDSMLTEEYTVFKCNWKVTDQVDYNEHCQKMHGVKPMDLRQEQNIKVDSRTPFKLESAMNIEQLGNNDHWAILNNWFTKGVASEILSKSINKAAIDVNEARSRELLNEIIVVTTQNFNRRFQIELKKKVGDITYGFQAKWSTIEKAFFAALGSDQVVERYNKFFEEGPSTLGGQSMESIISNVDSQVDRCFG